MPNFRPVSMEEANYEFERNANADGGSPALEQLTLADFIERGELDRHLRRLRLIYRERRAALVAALRRHLPAARISGVAAGLYALALLPAGTDEDAVVSAAAAEGLGVDGLAPHRIAHNRTEAGLVIGFASLAPSAIEHAVARLRGAYMP